MLRLFRPIQFCIALAVLACATVVGPAAANTADAEVEISGSIIDGDPSDDSGVLHAGFTITAFTPDGYPNSWTTTVSGGASYRLTVPAGHRYRLSIRGYGDNWAGTYYPDTPFASEAEWIEVGDTALSGIDLVAWRGGSITGVITQGTQLDYGDTARNMAVAQLINPKTGAAEDFFAAFATRADDSGRYEITGLPAGDYRVIFGQHRANHVGRYDAPRFEPEYYLGTQQQSAATVLQVAHGSTRSGIDAYLDPWTYSTDRIAGDDRYDTAAHLSHGAFATSGTAYIASGENWPDALSAGPAAAHEEAPLLLTRRDSLPPQTKAELIRLGVERIVVVGGPAAVGPNVVDELNGIAQVHRVYGDDRFATSRAVVAHAFEDGSKAVWVTSGFGFADALSAGSVAAVNDQALMLVDPRTGQPDAPTLTAWSQLGVQHVSIAGGPAAVPDSYADAVRQIVSSMSRSGGADRYETSSLISRDATSATSLATTPQTVMVANGTTFPDALAAAAVSGKTGAPVVLSDGSCVTLLMERTIRNFYAHQVTLVGGPGALSTGLDGFACLPPFDVLDDPNR